MKLEHHGNKKGLVFTQTGRHSILKTIF